LDTSTSCAVDASSGGSGEGGAPTARLPDADGGGSGRGSGVGASDGVVGPPPVQRSVAAGEPGSEQVNAESTGSSGEGEDAGFKTPASCADDASIVDRVGGASNHAGVTAARGVLVAGDTTEGGV